jgi:PKD repeat protein
MFRLKMLKDKSNVFIVLIITITGLGCLNQIETEITTTSTIIENLAPIADAGNNFEVSVNQEFPFNGSGNDPDGKIVLYEWDVDGDGVYDTSCGMCGKDKHSYDKPGEYQATLKVTDNQGVTNTDTITITVT